MKLSPAGPGCVPCYSHGTQFRFKAYATDRPETSVSAFIVGSELSKNSGLFVPLEL